MEKQARRDTRTKLIRAAEKLFAENGLGAVSVRDITRAAGARNESALHYHFGSKEALIRAVFADRIQVIDKARTAMLQAIDDAGDSQSLPKIMEAAVGPMLEACKEEGGRLYAMFLAQLTADPRFDVVRLIQELAPDSVQAVTERAVALLQHLPHETRNTRMQRLTMLCIALMADYARSVADGTEAELGHAIEEAGLSLAGYLDAPAPGSSA